MLNWSLLDCKRELVETNAYQLQSSLSERVVVDGHGCHTALHCVSKLKKPKAEFLRCIGYLNSIITPIKQDLLLILVLVRQQKLSSTVKRYTRNPLNSILVY